MEDLRNKDQSIIAIWDTISKLFGDNFFTIVDFWEGDNYALGFRKGDKLIYISTWHFRENLDSGNCFSEFELIDESTLETKKHIKRIDNIKIELLINEIRTFLSL